MAETKLFTTDKVMSVVTDVLVCDVGGVYEVLNWMSGESLFTHQLPRVGREAVPVILAAHPRLQSAIDEAEQVNADNWQLWLNRWIDRFGPEIAIPKMSIGQHERIDPVSEAAEHFAPQNMIVAKIDKGDADG